MVNHKRRTSKLYLSKRVMNLKRLNLFSLGKKGQFYLLTSIILLTVLWASLPEQNIEFGVAPSFEQLRTNYISEMPYVINNALSTSSDLSELSLNVQSFTTKFIDYANTKQVNFGVVYLIKIGSSLEVGNFIGESVIIESLGDSSTLASEATSTYKVKDQVTIYMGETTFPYEFSNEPVEFKALFKQIS